MTLGELIEKVSVKIDKIDISSKRNKPLVRCTFDIYMQTPERVPYINKNVLQWYIDSFLGVTTLFVNVDHLKRG